MSAHVRRIFFLTLALALAPSCISAAELPAPALVVLNKTENTLVVVDPATLKVVGAPIPTGEGPHEVAVWPERKLAVVGNYGSGPSPGNTLSVIDLAAHKELRRFDLGALRRPHGIWQAGGKFWFTAEGARVVGRYDPETDRLDWQMGTGQNGTHMVVVSRDQRKVFTANLGSDSITALQLVQGPQGPAGWQITQIQIGRAHV